MNRNSTDVRLKCIHVYVHLCLLEETRRRMWNICDDESSKTQSQVSKEEEINLKNIV